MEQQIPCPVCANKISFDARQLLLGVTFECLNCGASVGLAAESRPIVDQTLQKLDNTLKQSNHNEQTG